MNMDTDTRPAPPAAMDKMTLANPLGLVFETPKSEKNLRAATLFESSEKEKHAGRTEQTSPVSAWIVSSGAIAQVLG